MRLTDEQIIEEWLNAPQGHNMKEQLLYFARRVLAAAAQPDAPSDYADVERRGFEVSQPGELPK